MYHLNSTLVCLCLIQRDSEITGACVSIRVSSLLQITGACVSIGQQYPLVRGSSLQSISRRRQQSPIHFQVNCKQLHGTWEARSLCCIIINNGLSVNY